MARRLPTVVVPAVDGHQVPHPAIASNEVDAAPAEQNAISGARRSGLSVASRTTVEVRVGRSVTPPERTM